MSNRSSGCLVRLVFVEHLWLLVPPALMPVESQPHSWGAWLGLALWRLWLGEDLVDFARTTHNTQHQPGAHLVKRSVIGAKYLYYLEISVAWNGNRLRSFGKPGCFELSFFLRRKEQQREGATPSLSTSRLPQAVTSQYKCRESTLHRLC